MARSKKRRKFNFAKDFFTITVVLATLFAISKLIIKKPDNPNLIIATINGDNIYRVYPHTLFCNKTFKDKCMTHNDEIVFYIDNHHPSLKGSHLINELIIKEIEKIESAF